MSKGGFAQLVSLREIADLGSDAVRFSDSFSISSSLSYREKEKTNSWQTCSSSFIQHTCQEFLPLYSSRNRYKLYFTTLGLNPTSHWIFRVYQEVYHEKSHTSLTPVMSIMSIMHNLSFEGHHVSARAIEEFGCTRLLEIYRVLWNFYFETDSWMWSSQQRYGLLWHACLAKFAKALRNF